MIPPEQDIQNRRVVWRTLSELFLDTELQEASLSAMAYKLSQSNYSLEEIELILYREVYPACISNLRSVAGEWAGFDFASLEDAILAHTKSTWSLSKFVQPNRWMIRRDWERVKVAYAELGEEHQ